MRRPSVFFLLALCAGIWWYLQDVKVALFTSMVVLLSLIFEPSFKKVLLMVIACILGVVITQAQLKGLDAVDSHYSSQHPFSVQGILYQKDLLDPTSCWLKTESGSWLRLKFSPFKPMPTVFSGMAVRVQGTYLSPEPARNPGGFHELRWLHAKGAAGSVEVSSLKAEIGGSGIEQWRFQLGKPLVESLLQNTAFQQGPMAAGMLFGEDAWIPPDVLEAYKTAGTNHILSVSGAHFGILLYWVYWFTEKRQSNYYAKKIGIWLLLGCFIWLIGADSAAVRAYYMFLLLDLSRWAYKQPDALNCLSMTLGLMLLTNPLLIWDVGLQLAFAAMYGLLVLAPFLLKVCGIDGESYFQKCLKTLVLSLSASLCLYPILCTQFNNFSWWSLVYNIPVAFLSGICLPLSALVAGLTTFTPIARGIGIISGGAIGLMTAIVKTSLLLPQTGPVPSLQPLSFGLYVMVLLLPLYCRQLSAGVMVIFNGKCAAGEGIHRLRGLCAALVFSLALVSTQVLPKAFAYSDELRISYLDVGQGDGSVIQTPEGKVIVIDAGLEKGRYQVADSLLKLGIGEVDWLIISHPHSDHLGGAQAILDKLKVKKISYFEGQYAESEALVIAKLKTETEAQGGVYVPLKKGDQFSLENSLGFRVLHPPANFDSESANDESLVLSFRYENTHFLFTGDISTQVEYDIIREVQLGKTVLKVPHHGSATSSSADLVGLDNLELAVIQVGRKNRYGHPKQNVLKAYEGRGIQIKRNDESGCIQVFSDGEDLSYSVQIQED